MKLKIVLAIASLAATTVLAQAQPAPPANVPKPTKADVQKVVQIVSTDKAKSQAYCSLAKLEDQMGALDPQKDEKKLEALSNQADEVAEKIGPEYVSLMDGLDQVDENSPAGKDIAATLGQLDSVCGSK